MAQAALLKHVPGLEDAIAKCCVCGKDTAVLLWRHREPFVQACPLCGAMIAAERQQDGTADTSPAPVRLHEDGIVRLTWHWYTSTTQDENSPSDAELRALFGED